MINAQSSKIFLCFRAKNLKSFNFYLLANPTETAYLSFRDRELSNDVLLVQVRPRKVSIHTFFGLAQGRLMRPPSCRNFQKPKLFCLTSYPGEISHSNSANWEFSNNVRLLEVCPRKVALHTISHLTPIETWRKAVSNTSDRRTVSSEVRLEKCTQVLGVGQNWRACDSWLRKNSTSHLLWLVQTCPNLSAIQWPCALVAQSFFALS